MGTRNLIYLASWHLIVIGIVLFSLSTETLALLTPLLGATMFSAGVLVGMITVELTIPKVQFKMIGVVLFGILLQNIPAPVLTGDQAMFLGLGAVAVGAAFLAGKEAWCFYFKEGWILTAVYPIFVLSHAFYLLPPLIYLAEYIILAILTIILVLKKWEYTFQRGVSAMAPA